MKPRNFPDWISAYEAYSNDSFVPELFNTWSALSVVAGALERRVWLPWTSTYSFHPNIYVLLVSLPGVGKSTALTRAVDLLKDVQVKSGKALKLIPSQVTEAKFIELMEETSSFNHGNVLHMQSAGYYFASEASNALKNIYGDFIACLTEFYDCPKFWEKATLKGGKITLKNVAFNVLAGSTFDYLGKLVTDDNIMGGFASRLIYVPHREKLVRDQDFQQGLFTKADEANKADLRAPLVEDLAQILDMSGPFSADEDFKNLWKPWYKAFEEERQSNESEKLQSLLVRGNTNLLKVSMLLSASESSDRKLKGHHFERAKALIEQNMKEVPAIFRSAKATDTKSQEGLNQAIFREFELRPETTIPELKVRLMHRGFSPMMIEGSVKYLETSGKFQQTKVSASGISVKLLSNADKNL